MMRKVERARRKFTDVVDAWAWLNSHPVFDFNVKEVVLDPNDINDILDKVLDKAAGRKEAERFSVHDNTFAEGLSIELVRVNPKSRRIEDDDAKNTEVEVWLEAGGPVEVDGRHWRFSHDILLDCGGATFEAALLEMAKLVLKHYGDYKVGEHDA